MQGYFWNGDQLNACRKLKEEYVYVNSLLTVPECVAEGRVTRRRVYVCQAPAKRRLSRPGCCRGNAPFGSGSFIHPKVAAVTAMRLLGVTILATEFCCSTLITFEMTPQLRSREQGPFWSITSSSHLRCVISQRDDAPGVGRKREAPESVGRGPHRRIRILQGGGERMS